MIITLLRGEKTAISSVDLVEGSYFPRKRLRTQSLPYPISVNDDLETRTHKFRTVKDKSGSHHLAGDSKYESSIKIISNHERLFLCSMLTDSEVKELERAWNGSIPIRSADRNPLQPYQFYACERLTMIVKPGPEYSMMIMPWSSSRSSPRSSPWSSLWSMVFDYSRNHLLNKNSTCIWYLTFYHRCNDYVLFYNPFHHDHVQRVISYELQVASKIYSIS